jgi:hypothetical protein
MILPGSTDFPWPTLDLDPSKLIALTHELMAAGFRYGLGAKIVPLSLQAPDIYGTAEDGSHVPEVDCSGFVRWAVFHACGGLEIPDGSANQHDWFDDKGFKASNYDGALLDDGIVRIGFLSPSDTSEGIGHVMFAYAGWTCESHGGNGPDRRQVSTLGFAKSMHWYVASVVGIAPDPGPGAAPDHSPASTVETGN